ncbi:MAG: phosphotyrosine protein phosphatase [Pseudomonadota bacterium]
MTRVLFICGKARARSPTAAQIFADLPGVSTDFGGISRDADDALSGDQIAWADLILVMEPRHRQRLTDRFGRLLDGRPVVSLGIRDRFSFMAPELIAELREKAGPYLRNAR